MEILRTIISEIIAFVPQFLLMAILVILATTSFFLISALIVVPVAFLIEKFFGSVIPKLFPKIIRRRKLRFYNPDLVLKELLSQHPAKFSYRDIVEVLADCIPFEKEVYANGNSSFNWHWILKLHPMVWDKVIYRYAYARGWFDPRLWEPTTAFSSWLFKTPDEALRCAITAMKVGKGITKPNHRLYDFLMTQIKDGRKTREYPV
jgi:hypothetical protein